METNYSKLMSGFTKLFSTIVHSTVWREDMHVKVVWITMLAMTNRNGRVFASVPGLAAAANVTLDQCVDALKNLSSPDTWSRTKTNEGRRIEECDGGWQVLNYLKYREMRDDDERRIQTRVAVAKHREREKAKLVTVSQGKPRKAQAEAEAEAEAEADRTGDDQASSCASEGTISALPSVSPPPKPARPRPVQGPGAGAGTNPRDHLKHGYCPFHDWSTSTAPCVPVQLHGQFVQQLGHDADRLARFYLDIASTTVTPCGDDPWNFWRAHFTNAFGQLAPPPRSANERRRQLAEQTPLGVPAGDDLP